MLPSCSFSLTNCCNQCSGRGIWRCLYDPDSSLLVSAGFDSTIKVHQLYSSSSMETREQGGLIDDLKDQREIFEICAPKLTKQLGLMDRYTF